MSSFLGLYQKRGNKKKSKKNDAIRYRFRNRENELNRDATEGSVNRDNWEEPWQHHIMLRLLHIHSCRIKSNKEIENKSE